MNSFDIEIAGGARNRSGVVVGALLPDGVAWEASNVLLSTASGDWKGQITEQGELVFVAERLAAGETVGAKVTPAELDAGIQAVPSEGRVDLLIGGDLFTSYNYSSDFAKPFLAPIVGPYGDAINRPIDPSIREHPHQRGIFIAHGEVCGEEIWNEPEGRHGRCVQSDIQLQSGAVAVKMTTENTWKDRDGKALMDETRTITVYALPAELRIIDLALVFKAAHGEALLGGTKEAGFLGIRMHPDINVNANKGGRMENCYGAVGEAECWSKRAHWCDYHGIVNGKRVGIAAFDHAQNLRFPTHWHIRDYGLFAANPWYWCGDHTIPEGETLTFRYRVLVHAGDTQDAGITEQYIHYDVPPVVKFL